MKYLPILVVLMGCDMEPQKAAKLPIAECDTKAMASWILECVEKANPHSDEEPEDNTSQCEATAVHLFCGTNCFKSTDGTFRCREQ